jgi:hypothetical protein
MLIHNNRYELSDVINTFVKLFSDTGIVSEDNNMAEVRKYRLYFTVRLIAQAASFSNYPVLRRNLFV